MTTMESDLNAAKRRLELAAEQVDEASTRAELDGNDDGMDILFDAAAEIQTALDAITEARSLILAAGAAA